MDNGDGSDQVLAKWNIITYNCRSLLSETQLTQLVCELDNIDWTVVGLSEVRRLGEKYLDMNEYNLFYNGESQGQGGTGFLFKKNRNWNVAKIKTYTHRISVASVDVQQKDTKLKIKLAQVYAPTSSADDEEIEFFFI